MKTLECSSAGDKRFSAFYAKIEVFGIFDTIENHYQKCKRDASGNPCKKGQKVSYCMINDKKVSAEMLTPFYRYLWFKYLKENPELVTYAKQFDAFNDKFKGKAINCQADCIRAFVNKDKEFYRCISKLKQTFKSESEK